MRRLPSASLRTESGRPRSISAGAALLMRCASSACNVSGIKMEKSAGRQKVSGKISHARRNFSRGDCIREMMPI
jgi:hypothetical protein